MGGLLQQLEVLQRHRCGDDLNLAGIADGVAQAHITAVLTALTGFRQHLTLGDLGISLNHRLGIGRQVVHITCQHPHPAQTLGLEGDVALTVGHFPGLDRFLVAHLTGQVANHVLGGFLDALLHRTSGDLSNGHISIDGLTVFNKQQRTIGDLNFLGFALSRRLDGEVEVNLGLLGIDAVGRAVRTNPGLGRELDGARHNGTHHTGFGRGHTTGVEGAHRELRSGLTDGLGRNDANGFAEVHQFVVGQGPAIALATDGAVGLTGKGRAHAHRGDPCLFDAF